MSIIEDYYKKEYRTLIKRVKNRAGSVENAEDVVQEAFCKALKHINTYNPKGEFGGWFNSILENELKDFKRADRLGGMTTVNIDDVAENIPAEVVEQYLPNMTNLKPLHKKMVNMYFVLGHSTEEIAEILDVPFNTVRDFLKRFRNKIRVGND